MTVNELDGFYAQILNCIETYGLFTLKDVDGRHPWPEQGVYFFFDRNEPNPGLGLPGRIVRVGSHGVAANKNSALWARLRQHRGSLKNGGGNHRCSIFRWHIGTAIEGMPPSWLNRNTSNSEVARLEHKHECFVSDYIRELSFTVIKILGTPSKDCQRAVFERECIAFLSWAGQNGLIKTGNKWLGLQTVNDKIKKSGLWNVKDVWKQEQPLPCPPIWPSLKDFRKC